MTARMRRLTSDWEQVRKDFTGHKNIVITPVGTEPPEKYHVTYFVNGIYLLPDGKIERLARHEVEITLHAEYPRYKPICKILTPIWHPNFRDGQICIGDIWGAGESLSDIIINIGDMIQYKSWNSYSPLSADAAQWAMENKHLFPVGTAELYIAEDAGVKETVEIDLFDDNGQAVLEAPATAEGGYVAAPEATQQSGNDFEITAEELAGIEFVPTADRMQQVSHGGMVKGGKVNFKTILVKGLLWALIGSILGFGVSELAGGSTSNSPLVADVMGHSYLSSYYEYTNKADEAFDNAMDIYEDYCRRKGLDDEDMDNFSAWLRNGATSEAEDYLEEYSEYDGKANEALYESYLNEFDEDEEDLEKAMKTVQRASTGIWAGLIALFIGALLGLGEGIFYGSAAQAFKYAAIGAGISLGLGFISGFAAQWMYAELLPEDTSMFSEPVLLFITSLIRGFGWSIMGLGVGVAVGLIKPEKKRILFCMLGGLAGGFVGGFLFNYVCEIIPNDIVARGVAIVIMGTLVGLGVGLLEQFAKQAWLKVIRGEFEGKEYLVFSGTTSIGNTGKNTIVLFKDKLVGPHHCDIVLEGNKYVLQDCGTPMGTAVNGMRITKQILRHGDAIAIGNSVLVFNTK